VDLKDNFTAVRVAVIGDVMLDQYWWGNVERISPEAPVPVVRLQRTSLTLGGAGNVAANIKGLGATPLLIGCVGKDNDALLFFQQLDESSISAENIVTANERPTPVKTRVIAHSQHVVRVDREIAEPISNDVQSELTKLALRAIPVVDVVVISDYAKGTVTDRVLKLVIDECRAHGKPIVIDPKGKDYSKYSGATILTPNRREAADACGIDEFSHDAVLRSGERLLADLGVEAVLITEGENGVTIFEKGSAPVSLPAEAHAIYDVTGAGDTVIATLAVAIGAGMSMIDGVRLANTAASLVVEQVGTTAISFDALTAKLGNADFKFENDGSITAG
jgi:D-beta-D-heptose 7-phosphate kinase/D-beta-D-heptose 1-phosphate adenosyltransferase